MKFNALAGAALFSLGALAALPAQAVGRLADVTLIDRHSGATLPLHVHRGEYWVAGVPGARYAVMVRNRLGARLMAVTSVDGVNVLSGESAAVEQSGYVFAPWQSYQITGWRKSDSQVAAFEFSDASDSYAQRTGRPAHVGVIGVALFREKAAEYVPPPQMHVPAAKSQLGDSSLAGGSALGARAQAAPEALASRRHEEPATPKLGTAHGQREASYVQSTSFERRSAQPDELLRIRYDSRENLLAMGIIAPRPLPAGTPNPFPESPLVRYVPDPPAYR